VVVLVLGLGADAAASRILAATALAHGTGAAGDGGKVEDLGRGKRRWRGAKKENWKLLEQFVFWDENIYTPPSITYSGVNFLEYGCLSIGTDHTDTVHLLVYCLP
jgi:hypothetical protein